MRFFHRVIPVAFLFSIGTTSASAQTLPDFRAEILGQFFGRFVVGIKLIKALIDLRKKIAPGDYLPR